MVLGTQQYSPKLELLRTLAAQHAAYQVMLHTSAWPLLQAQQQRIRKTQDLLPWRSVCCFLNRGRPKLADTPLRYFSTLSLPYLQDSCCFAVVGDRTATTPEQLQELLETESPEPDMASPSDRLHSFDHIYPGAADSTWKEAQAAR